MMIVVRVQTIRILHRGVPQVQRVGVTQGILEKMVVFVAYVCRGNTKVRVHFVRIVLDTRILRQPQMLCSRVCATQGILEKMVVFVAYARPVHTNQILSHAQTVLSENMLPQLD